MTSSAAASKADAISRRHAVGTRRGEGHAIGVLLRTAIGRCSGGSACGGGGGGGRSVGGSATSAAITGRRGARRLQQLQESVNGDV